jgi:cell wall-associated NlpC family hydrolase
VHTPPRISLLVVGLAVLLAAAALLAWPGGSSARAAGGQVPPEKLLLPPPPAPSIGARAARIALGVVGVPYRYGGESPASGFDCSGLVRWTYGRLGIDLPHSSYALAAEGRRVSEEAMRPGDVLLFDGLGHVGLYLGRGRMIHAPYSGRTVEVVSLDSTGYGPRLVGARRIARS